VPVSLDSARSFTYAREEGQEGNGQRREGGDMGWGSAMTHTPGSTYSYTHTLAPRSISFGVAGVSSASNIAALGVSCATGSDATIPMDEPLPHPYTDDPLPLSPPLEIEAHDALRNTIHEAFQSRVRDTSRVSLHTPRHHPCTDDPLSPPLGSWKRRGDGGAVVDVEGERCHGEGSSSNDHNSSDVEGEGQGTMARGGGGGGGKKTRASPLERRGRKNQKHRKN